MIDPATVGDWISAGLMTGLLASFGVVCALTIAKAEREPEEIRETDRRSLARVPPSPTRWTGRIAEPAVLDQ